MCHAPGHLLSRQVFGFLAFGLYALNLAMGAGGGRRRRQVQGEEQCSDHSSNPGLVDGVMAFTTMFRGFLELLNENAGNHTDH